MDYFLISQDNRFLNRVEPIVKSTSFFNHAIAPVKLDEENPTQLKIRETASPEYVDFIERPIALVSDELKQILKVYEKAASFSPVVLADTKRGVQKLYWQLFLPKLKCLSDLTEFRQDKTVKKLVMNPAEVSDYRILQIDQTLEQFIVFNLIVLESLLRRGFTGFKFSKIELEPKQG